MLTDIFARRYEQPRMWETFYEEQRRLLVQSYQLLNDICPYHLDGKDNHGKDFWTQIHDLLARELGLKELSPQNWGFQSWENGDQYWLVCAPANRGERLKRSMPLFAERRDKIAFDFIGIRVVVKKVCS